MKLHPQREKLIVRPLKIDAVTKSGILMGGNAGEKEFRLGLVLEVGPGRDLEIGDHMTRIQVGKGDLIVYSPMAARYTLQGSLLEQFGFIPKGIIIVDYSEVFFSISPENDDEIKLIHNMLAKFDETTLNDEDAEEMQIRSEIELEDQLKTA